MIFFDVPAPRLHCCCNPRASVARGRCNGHAHKWSARRTHRSARRNIASRRMMSTRLQTACIPSRSAPMHLCGYRTTNCGPTHPHKRMCLKFEYAQDRCYQRESYPPSVRANTLHSRRASQTQCSSATAPSVSITDGEESYYDEDEASPSACYAESDTWSSTHLKKAQRRRQHDSRPGSQSLASRVQDVVRRPALKEIAKIPSR